MKESEGLVPKTEYHFQYFDIITESKETSNAYCPYCIDGYIVRDKYLDDVYFCINCFKKVIIPIFKG